MALKVGASDDRRIGAETPTPDAVAQHHDTGCAGLIVFGQEQPAERWLDARGEDLE